MGIKETVRPLLPPTSRAFLNRTDELSDAIERQAGTLLEIQSQLEHRMESEAEEIRSITRHVSYVNLEYLAKLSQSKSDVLLAGWYGAENLGDELMLQTVLECIPEEALSRVSVLLWDNYDYPIDLIDPRVTMLHYPNSTWELDQLANHFSALVWGGGAILDDGQYDDRPDNTNTGNLFIRLSKLMLARGKRVFSLGLSSNDVLSSERYLRELNAIVSQSRLFSLRDPISKAVLERAGIDTAKAMVCEDLAFASRQLASLPKHIASKNAPIRIAVAPLTLPSLSRHYQRVLARTLSAVGPDCELSLIPFLNSPQGRDVRYCTELAEIMGDERIVVKPYRHSIQDLHFERYDLVIAYKYHAALISLVQETPTLCIYDSDHPHYRNKVDHLAHLFSNEALLFSLTDFEGSVQNAVTDGLNRPTRLKPCGQLLKNQRSWLQDACDMILE